MADAAMTAGDAGTVAQALAEATAALTDAGVPSPEFDAKALLAEVLTGGDIGRIATLRRETLPGDSRAILDALVTRRCRREPLQYILGYTEFHGLRLKCDPGALIPRPDTETLVEQVLLRVAADVLVRPRITRLCDIGTGTGAIAIALAVALRTAADGAPAVEGAAARGALAVGGAAGGAMRSSAPRSARAVRFADENDGGPTSLAPSELTRAAPPNGPEASDGARSGAPPNGPAASPVHIWATDASADALDLAAENVALHGLQDHITLLHGDGLAPLLEAGIAGEIEAIVSNPPYVTEADYAGLAPEIVAHEPRLALVGGGDDGLGFYRDLLGQIEFMPALRLLAFEVGYDQAQALAGLIAQAAPEFSTSVHRDLGGIERVVIAERNR
jgi:release factor glutamine methyltransferase